MSCLPPLTREAPDVPRSPNRRETIPDSLLISPAAVRAAESAAAASGSTAPTAAAAAVAATTTAAAVAATTATAAVLTIASDVHGQLPVLMS